MKLRRRRFLHVAASAAALTAVSRVVRAQAYPSRPLTLMVFVPAGGTPDIIARLLGQSLSHRLGQSVVIDNRPGGGGNLALQAVARAPADGYTLLLVASPHVINVTLYEKSATTVTRDIVPVASTNNDSFVLLVNPSFPAKTVAEFIAYAKANPGKINLTHLSGELFRMMTGDRGGVRALSGYAGRAFGTDRRRCARDVRRRRRVGTAYPVGCVARAWRDGEGAPAGVAGRSSDWRCCPGLRGDRLPRHWRSPGHPGRDRRAAQSGGQRGARRAGGDGANGRTRQ